MPLFDMTRCSRAQDAKILGATTKKTSATIKGGGSLSSKIELIRAKIQSAEIDISNYQLINEKEVLHDFISECISNQYIAIDTETTGLNPALHHIVGICPFTPNAKSSYIPLNHISSLTNNKLPNQLDAEFVIAEFSRLLKTKPDIDMFNAPFDIRVLRKFGLPDIYCTWDCSLAARVLNENENISDDGKIKRGGLKPLWDKYCSPDGHKSFTYGDLFNGITFDFIPLDIAIVYACGDPIKTYDLGEFQRKHLNPNSDREDMRKLYWAFKNIEMPIVKVVCDMEDSGISLDNDRAEELSVKYHKLLDESQDRLNNLFKTITVDGATIDELIYQYSLTSKIQYPMNVNSATQLAILLYDIMKMPEVDRRKPRGKPRGTSEEIIEKFDSPIVKEILTYKKISKLLGTFIDKLPKCTINGKIHGKFNSYGAVTGRFSSSDPNLQQIPSHNKEIRTMFVASDGCVLMSADFSQQEPKALAALCRAQGDSQMYDTFMAGKDLYVEIASASFHKPYEECIEHFPKDTPIRKVGDKWFYATMNDYDKLADGEEDTYTDGKERRGRAKAILLGVLYGRGEDSIAEKLQCTKEEAIQIKESVFKGFPAIKKFEADSIAMAKELGYVTTIAGRKRRLPIMQLPEFEFAYISNDSHTDVLDFGNTSDAEVDYDTCLKWYRKLKNTKPRDRYRIIDQAKQQGIQITDNTYKIAETTRQVVNSRIQGSSADLTKVAMIKLSNNERLKELGFKLLIQVHDEVICECPKENVAECKELLANIMSAAAEELLDMPIKCDVTVSDRWFGEKYEE